MWWFGRSTLNCCSSTLRWGISTMRSGWSTVAGWVVHSGEWGCPRNDTEHVCRLAARLVARVAGIRPSPGGQPAVSRRSCLVRRSRGGRPDRLRRVRNLRHLTPTGPLGAEWTDSKPVPGGLDGRYVRCEWRARHERPPRPSVNAQFRAGSGAHRSAWRHVAELRTAEGAPRTWRRIRRS